MTKINKSLTKLFLKSNINPRKFATYTHNSDCDWIINQSGLPWLELKLPVPYEEILEEIIANADFLIDHRDDYGEHEGWKSFCIHGKSLHTTQHCVDNRPYQWIPEILSTMPRTVEYFKSWNLEFVRLRVMALEPGGYVSVHRDTTESFLTPINIAITQPIDCKFVIEDWGIVPFQVGKAFILDVSNRHAVINNSNETRYHIIAHYNKLTADFNTLIKDCYSANISNGSFDN
jgi:Aspartyl/Asparaginyl beta-hydroxylase